MPRQQPFPPPIQHHKASGRARVRWQGKDYYLGAFGSEEATKNYAELLTRLAGGREPNRTRHDAVMTEHDGAATVAVVVARWFSEEAPRYSDAGREAKQFTFACRPLLRLFGTLPAGQFDCDRLEQVQLSMAGGTWQNPAEREKLQARGRPLQWSRNVVNRAVTRIRTIWRWAERKRLVPPGAFAHLCALPGLKLADARVRHRPKRKPATFATVKACLRHCPPQVRTMLLLQWWTGMRSGEVRLMRPCDIDRTGNIWVYRPHRHKTEHLGSTRAIPLGVKCQTLLRPWLDRGPEEYLFRPLEAVEAWNAVRRSRRKTKVQPSQQRRDRQRAAKRRADPRWSVPFTAFGYPQAVRRACRRAGVPAFEPYAIRHAAKDRITAALGLDVARSVLGQKSIGTTNGYGNAVDLEAAKKAARRLG